MPIDYNALAIPKGKTRKQVKAKRDREDAKALEAFRQAVWDRESEKFGQDDGFALCQRCGTLVSPAPGLLFGEVDHIRPRSLAPELRYESTNGRLLCRICHRKVTEHR